MNKTITFELTVDQTNIVLESLSRMPYQAVAGLIAELQKQAASQIQSQAESTVNMPMPNNTN